EWYRANEPYQALMDDCAAILALAAQAAGSKRFAFRERAIDPFATPERLTVADAFSRYAGIDLAAMLPPEPSARLPTAARAAGGGCRRRSHRRRRRLGRYLQPRAGREDRAAARARAGDDPLRVSGGAVAACPADGRRPAACRALRALCLRHRARQRIRRAHRR